MTSLRNFAILLHITSDYNAFVKENGRLATPPVFHLSPDNST